MYVASPAKKRATSANPIGLSSEEKAAITIQKHWRGYKVRKAFKNPSNPAHGAKEVQLFPVGNDPVPQVEKMHVPRKHPAVITAGGVQCLRNAMRLTMASQGTLGAKPKIFIIDHDQRMIVFWKVVKRAFYESDDLKSFLSKIPKGSIDKEMDVPWYPPEIGFEQRAAVWLIDGILSDECRFGGLEKDLPEADFSDYDTMNLYQFFEQVCGSNKDRYQWLKKLVVNQVYPIHGCWVKTTEAFRFVREVCDHHGYEPVVYMSNIADFYCPCCLGTKLWENIQRLSPAMVVRVYGKKIAEKEWVPAFSSYLSGQEVEKELKHDKNEQSGQ